MGELEGAVRASSVVVPPVLGQDSSQVPFAEDEHPVSHVRSNREHEALRVSICAGTWGGFFTAVTSASARAASNDAVNARPGCTRNRTVWRDRRDPSEDSDLLHDPGPIGIRDHANDVRVSAADLHNEEDVDPLEGHRAVHVEEVADPASSMPGCAGTGATWSPSAAVVLAGSAGS